MSFLQRIPRATAPAAIGSLVSLAAQGVLAVFLLKLFDAHAVGVFSVVSQIAFCWATLALAQSPVSLLANHQHEPRCAAAVAWRQSMRRMLWLAPLMALALYWSQSHGSALKPGPTPAAAQGFVLPEGWIALAGWVSLIAITQMSWLLAQSLTLRTQGPRAIALVRLVPPVLAALLAWVGAQGLGATQATTLLLASLLGYSAGMLWMAPAARKRRDRQTLLASVEQPVLPHSPPSDARSTQLKMLHTLTDVLCSTVLAIQWQSLYGPAQAGYLLVLLRVFGFVPALVHTAWAQALISRPHEQKLSPLWVASAASALIALLVLSLEAALHWQWLEPSWQNLWPYVWPLALWQMAACLSAAHAHLPFWQGRTRQFSHQSMAINAIMVSLLLIKPSLAITATTHLQWLSGFMVLALSLQALYFSRQSA
ncbi:MAG: hypothetical protein ACOYB1_15780 [Limnohabitans sp.]